MCLPAEIIPILAQFAPVFTAPTYQKALVLVVGTILAQGLRTVTSALRAVGYTQTADWAKYHNVSSSGLRWLVFALVVNVPWTPYAWALPFLSVLLTTPKVSAQLDRRPKTVAHVTGQVVLWLRRTLPGRAIHLVGDGAYAVIALGLRCQHQQVTLLAPLRLDARLFEPPLRLVGKHRGHPAVGGARLPNLELVAIRRPLGGTAVACPGIAAHTRSSIGRPARPYGTRRGPRRWLLLRDPQGERPIRAFFSTESAQGGPSSITDFVNRWPLEVTFEEARSHLGLETQRQWSDLAVERTTPARLGLFSLIVLLAQTLYPTASLPLPQAAWYPKAHATFHDALALVRRRFWQQCLFQTDAVPADLRLINPAHLEHLLSAVCY